MHEREGQNQDPLRDASRGVRLQKALADAGVGSRRACEELIETGSVSVNGRVVKELPAWVDPKVDDIVVEGRRLPKSERHIYVMLYKPKNVVSTVDDPSGRKTVAELVQHPSGARLYPVGRLDYDTTGLILLTNDGEFANRLTHPRYGVHKTYRAIVKGKIEPEDVQHIEEGVYLAERKEGKTHGAKRTARVKIAVIKRDTERTLLELTLSEGRNRQVRRMLAQVGHPVRKLERVAMGPVRLKGLRLGEWRELERSEVRALRDAASAPEGATEPKTARKAPAVKFAGAPRNSGGAAPKKKAGAGGKPGASGRSGGPAKKFGKKSVSKKRGAGGPRS